jgi:hypothetical protein
MTDYYETSVVNPSIPNSDILPIELLLLSEIFDSKNNEIDTYFFNERSTANIINICANTLSEACQNTTEECTAKAIANIALLKAIDHTDKIEIDFSDYGWTEIFADIVKRSSTIDYISITRSYHASRIIADGFGGSAIFITDEGINHISTYEWLENMIAHAQIKGKIPYPANSTERQK